MIRPAGALVPLPPPLGEVLEFMRVIWALDHALQKTSKSMKTAIGVTGPQRLAIRLIARFPGIPAGQLSELLHVHPSTLTGILRRLERQGVVRRRADPRDGRRALFGVTEKGRRIDAIRVGTVEACVQRVTSGADRTRLQHAREILQALARSLEETTREHRPGRSARRAAQSASRR